MGSPSKEIMPNTVNHNIYVKALSWLPLFRSISALIQGSRRTVLVHLRNLEGDGIVKVVLSKTHFSCSCTHPRSGLCAHIVLVLMAFNSRDNQAACVSVSRITYALRDFHFDSLDVGAPRATHGHDMARRMTGTTKLAVYEQGPVKLSMLRGRLIDIICKDCGDRFVEGKRAACKCAIETLIEIIQ